ncbi:ABC transporter ATP-binding protein [Chryseobacterium sp. NRRL B-14859]|uniref:ABC transporter ATP-binding protein n=1 Tax=Chryseobacterium sp. NRRL B-14859 TaxID=1562763 RepID=UPI0033964409
MIEIENVTVKLNGKQILKDISLKILPGQFVGIIGPNGSGKSTLLKSIYKIIKPSSGNVFIHKKNITEISFAEMAKKIAVVGQFNSTELDCSVTEFVIMGRYPHKGKYERMDKDDYDIVRQALDFMDMTSYGTRKISELSGGERQRVVIARALAQQPQCLILDEPTNHLDIKYQLQLLNKLKGLPITVIMSIHDIAFAYNFFEYIIALKDGELVKSGTPDEVITAPIIKEMFDVDIKLSHCENEDVVCIYYDMASLLK